MDLPCIFLIDNDSATLESYKFILEAEGFKIFTATNGLEFWDLMLKYVPDLILMDYHLGEENGAKLTEIFKNNPQTSHIPVIVISANAKCRSSAMFLGADDFIEKPIEIPFLISKIKEYVTA